MTVNKQNLKTVKYLRKEDSVTSREWMKANVGKCIDMDGVYGCQCVDVIKKYYKDIIGISPQLGNAIDYWTKYPTGSFTKVVNTPSGVPPVGSILIWNIGSYGHIGVVYSANVNQVETFEQNWNTLAKGPTEFRMHNYSNVLGWLTPKKDVNFDQAAYQAQLDAQAKATAEAAAKTAADAEAARLLQEAEAKALADQKAKEEAAAAKAEADRIAAEQAKRDAEMAAKEAAQIAAEKELQEKQNALWNFVMGIFNWLKGLINGKS